jgi:hypothetical protein
MCPKIQPAEVPVTSEASTAHEPKDVFAKTAKMQFILVGFSHDLGSRIFEFTGIAADRTRMGFTVGVDLAIIRRYSIRMQELPLLCREFLERHGQGEDTRTLTFTEEEMRLCADSRATAQAEAALKRKSPRKPPAENAGGAWRTPQPLGGAYRWTRG